MPNRELPRVMPEFSTESLSEPVNLLEKNNDPRKTAYVTELFLSARQSWQDSTRVPMVFELYATVDLLDHEVISPDRVEDAIQKGRTVKPRRGNYEARTHMASEHMLTVMAGTRALSDMAKEQGLLDEGDAQDIIAAAALHDLFKSREVQLVRAAIDDPNAGFGQAGYDQAGEEHRERLEQIGVKKDIIALSQEAGHTACPPLEHELSMTQGDLSVELLKRLILHYVDDIVTNPNIIDPTITTDENGTKLNALDRRCLQNEKNQNYVRFNQAWTQDPRNNTGETAFVMQRRVGHLVEAAIANSLGIDDPLTLPQVISDRMQQNIQQHWDAKRRKN
jgi:hypothetical protein